MQTRLDPPAGRMEEMNMTSAEQIAYDAGKLSISNGYNAPCYDPVMQSIVFEPRSNNGKKRLDKILAARYAGREEIKA